MKVNQLDVVDGGILGALVPCHECGGSGELHRVYRTPDGGMIDVHRGVLSNPLEQPEETPEPAEETPDILMTAWGVIANAYGGDWDSAPDEWRTAAESFRGRFHSTLGDVNILSTPPDVSETNTTPL
jgi:hypothetical protein